MFGNHKRDLSIKSSSKDFSSTTNSINIENIHEFTKLIDVFANVDAKLKLVTNKRTKLFFV